MVVKVRLSLQRGEQTHPRKAHEKELEKEGLAGESLGHAPRG